MSQYDKQRQAAETYLKAKQIPELLSYLLELVAYAKPEDPRKFVHDAVKKLQANKPDWLFADDELKTMFEMIDITTTKFISVEQLKNAYANLGGAGQELSDAQLPKAVKESGKVDLETFKKIIGERLQTKNVW